MFLSLDGVCVSEVLGTCWQQPEQGTVGVCALGVASMFKLSRIASKSPEPAHLACDIQCQRAVRLGTGGSAMHGTGSSASSEQRGGFPISSQGWTRCRAISQLRPFQILSPRITSPRRPSWLPKPSDQ